MFDREQKSDAFDSYESYMEYLFVCVNEAINRYLQRLKEIYATGQGDYKNVLYPDLEIAHDTCKEKLGQFRMRGEERQGAEKAEETGRRALTRRCWSCSASIWRNRTSAGRQLQRGRARPGSPGA